MGKINLDNVRGITVPTVLADKEYENGLVVGLGDLVEGEHNMYKAVAGANDNAYLITTPEVDRTSKSSSIDHTNKKGSHMRVHQLEKGDIFTVEASLHGATATVGQKVDVSGNQFVDASGDGFAVVIEAGTIGADQREAISLRVL